MRKQLPDVIDLRKTQRKEPEKPLYHVRSLALLHRHLTCRSKARKQQVFPLAMFLLCIWRSLVRQKIFQAYYMADDFFQHVKLMVLQRWMKICSDE
jgi:hypothetical protein